jgi:hypothetical protein
MLTVLLSPRDIAERSKTLRLGHVSGMARILGP